MARLTKKHALSLSAALLFALGVVDFIRGFMHTFMNDYASTTFAQINQDPDALFLLGVFGVSNFVTSFLFFLVYFKARHLSPHVLLIVFAGYVLGVIGIRTAGLSMQSPFYGQYMMFAYLAATLLVPLMYFIANDDKPVAKTKKRKK